MAQESTGRGATTAQVAGDIQAGLTGDKIAGFDPSAAPLGTDDEAGGSTFDAEWLERTRWEERAGRPSGGAANAGTPELQPNARLDKGVNLTPVAAGLGLGVAAILALLMAALI